MTRLPIVACAPLIIALVFLASAPRLFSCATLGQIIDGGGVPFSPGVCPRVCPASLRNGHTTGRHSPPQTKIPLEIYRFPRVPRLASQPPMPVRYQAAPRPDAKLCFPSRCGKCPSRSARLCARKFSRMRRGVGGSGDAAGVETVGILLVSAPPVKARIPKCRCSENLSSPNCSVILSSRSRRPRGYVERSDGLSTGRPGPACDLSTASIQGRNPWKHLSGLPPKCRAGRA